MIEGLLKFHHRTSYSRFRRCIELIDKIRNSIPEEVKRAEMVSTEKEELFRRLKSRADDQSREEYAAKLVKKVKSLGKHN